MRAFLIILCLFHTFSVFSQNDKYFTIKQFDFEGKDSLKPCQVVEKYKKLSVYINNLVLNEIRDEEVKYSTRNAIDRLLANSFSSTEKFGFQDYSIEEKSHFYYEKDNYIKKLIDLKNTLDAYEKVFLANNCTVFQKNSANVLLDDKCYTPLVNGKVDFLESTRKSYLATSNVRNLDSTIIGFQKIDAKKNINIRLMKILKPDVDYLQYITGWIKPAGFLPSEAS